MWWNWQTRYFEVVVAKAVQVQVLPRAPFFLEIRWQPTKALRIGLEYHYGFHNTLSGADGEGHRLNFVLKYDLVR